MRCRVLLLLFVVLLPTVAGCASDSPDDDGATRPTAPATRDVQSPPEPAVEPPAQPDPSPSTEEPAPAPSPLPPPPLSTPVLPCPDVLVIGARGSGQPDGIGPGIERFVDALAEQVEGQLAAVPVDYAASIVGGALVDPDAFEDAVQLGAARLLQLTARQVRACPDSPVVWAGFSQGALVLRTAMDGIADPASAGVSAVVLLADPRRAPGDPVDRGPADSAIGAPGRLQPSPVPAAWVPVTTSWCATEDPICTAAADEPLEGLLQHAGGYADLPLVHDAAAAVAGLVGS